MDSTESIWIIQLQYQFLLFLFRGESDSKYDEPFRAWYGRLGEIRSLLQCPILLITATANKAARVALRKKFALQDFHEIIDNPDRGNIKLFVNKFKSSVPLGKLFYFLINLLNEKQENCERYLIFCQSIKSCSDIFTAFRLEGVNTNLIEMFHSKTVEAVKEKIKMNMQDPDGQIRILIATSAAGMGVNYKGVNNVIHFGPPKDMDSFVQQLGRVGRESNQHAMAMLLYNGRQCRNLDSDMKSYIQSENIFRRGVMLAAYNAKPLPDCVKHLCCDNCTGSCKCGSGDCGTFEHLYNKVKLPEFSSESESDSDDNDSEFFD